MVHTLRRATAADAAAIAAVHVRAWQEAFRGLVDNAELDALSIDERATAWAELIADDERALTIVAEDKDHDISGFCTAYLPSRDDDAAAHVCEVAALYVAPERWRWGIGRALMRAALDKATAEGYEEVTLWVFEDNPAAREFYSGFAFAPDGATQGKPGRPPEMRLRLRLA